MQGREEMTIPSRAQRFWDRMMELYGMKWVNSYGQDPTEMWINLIDSLENYQITWAIKSLMNTGDSFVPTMPQVVTLARSAHKPPNPNQAAIAAEHREYTPEQCEANLKKLKRITQAASSGEFNGLSELQIEKIIEDW